MNARIGSDRGPVLPALKSQAALDDPSSSDVLEAGAMSDDARAELAIELQMRAYEEGHATSVTVVQVQGRRPLVASVPSAPRRR